MDLGGSQLDGQSRLDQGEDQAPTLDREDLRDLPGTPDKAPVVDTSSAPDVTVVLDKAIPQDVFMPDKTKPDLPPPKPDIKILLNPGSPCKTGSQCNTGFCVDKLCCSGPCKGKCMACNLSGAKGSCKFVPSGADPRNACKKVDPVSTCKLDGMCNGKGGCRYYPAGTPCIAAKCSSVATLQGLRKCDGGGACLPPPVTYCFPFNCNAATKKCYTSCAASNEITVCYGYYGCDTSKGTCYKSCSGDSQCNKNGECEKKKCEKD